MPDTWTPQSVIAILSVVGLFVLLVVAVWRLAALAATQEAALNALVNLLNPASFISLLILLGVFFLLGMAILDLDKGRVLMGMGKVSFARGLITFLFAIVTIGTAVVVVLSALLGADKEKTERGKEVLGLLLGVFGTIVGFYFASELNRGETLNELGISPALLSKTEVRAGESVDVTLAVRGGKPPYRFAVALGTELPETYPELARNDGWIQKNLAFPTSATAGVQTISIGVLDAAGEKAAVQTALMIKPP